MPQQDIIKRKDYNKKYLSEKIYCECGKIINRSSKPYHLKTELHILKIILNQKKSNTNKIMSTKEDFL